MQQGGGYPYGVPLTEDVGSVEAQSAETRRLQRCVSLMLNPSYPDSEGSKLRVIEVCAAEKSYNGSPGRRKSP